MLVWDLPMRLYHAALALLLVVAFATAATHHPAWHAWSGRLLLVLLVWRVLWGIIGSETARFGQFLGPPRLARRGGSDDGFGHAEAGGVLLLVTLGWLALVLATGFAHARPHAWLALLLLLPIALHLALVAVASARGGAPLRAILTGKKKLPANRRAPRRAPPLLALAALLCAIGLCFVASRLGA